MTLYAFKNNYEKHKNASIDPEIRNNDLTYHWAEKLSTYQHTLHHPREGLWILGITKKCRKIFQKKN